MNTWNGEGLPPAGTELEFRAMLRIHGADEFKRGKIAYCSSDTVVIQSAGREECYHTKHMEFRTLQQVAELEREKAISEMLRVPHCPLSEQAAGELYDAGYRKFEIVEDDV